MSEGQREPQRVSSPTSFVLRHQIMNCFTTLNFEIPEGSSSKHQDCYEPVFSVRGGCNSKVRCFSAFSPTACWMLFEGFCTSAWGGRGKRN